MAKRNGSSSTVTGRYVSYCRVSTARQGASGLGLEAQQTAVREYLAGKGWPPIAEFVEIESGRKSDRPELARALAACRLYGAVLVIAKLDRLARNAAFLLSLRDAGVEFVACDMPDANRLTVGIMAMVAEDEAERISARTKAALAAAKVRGTKLGGWRGYAPSDADRMSATEAVRAKADADAERLREIVLQVRGDGVSTAAGLAKRFNEMNIPTPRGGMWQAVSVQRLVARLGL